MYVLNGILSSHKRNEIVSFVATWISLKDNMVSEISQVQKQIHMFSPTCGSQKSYLTEAETGIVGPTGWEGVRELRAKVI
jgi:hypothetical protein